MAASEIKNPESSNEVGNDEFIHLTKGQGRVLTGLVSSNARDKTVRVDVRRQFKHPLYGKQVRKTTKYHAHTLNKLEIGTKVDIVECRPISKTKSWAVLKEYEVRH